ncbi:LSM domain-containing protein [Colletotrichum abscissum]|uniref:LSM2-LSM8 complex subunit LSM8 n=2 Tax=Colletotrichum acutatum species complex TaxID=2707335 RepID=A0A9Q0AZS7_9PEZI|nr:LSM domain-containing protein [Colletotrichum costaricense]XP_060390343.1 LSM domain-containing protein [Colletotrichum abscissum]KAI3542700.1 LSM domain-containing protein [Colletotrichum abscissum]KAK1473465.1 LSM domain-containing protein [Colletotrichum abscissum]KAK1527718.1 LSM domain-containing protein [Colletotrichum costaricense]
MATLGGYLNKKVLIVTSDSRILVGTLEAADQSTNLVIPLPLPPSQPSLESSELHPANTHLAPQVLSSAQERVIQTPESGEPSVEVPLGLYLVRGDNVCTIGLVDEALDESIDWTQVKGSAIGGTKHV